VKIIIEKHIDNEIKLSIGDKSYIFTSMDIDQEFYKFLVENIVNLDKETIIDIDNDDEFQAILKTVIENFIAQKP
jgi:hypothetical protein